MSTRISLITFFIVAASVANAEQSAGGANPSLPAPSAKSAQSAAAPNTTSTRTGWVVVTISGVILSNSPPPASRKLFCNVGVSTAKVPVSHRRGTAAAVISGNSFSCSIKLGYKWQVAADDFLTTDATVFGVDTSLSASEAHQLGYFQPYSEIHAYFPDTTPFPASGATTFKSATGLVY
jgi:hypothetical protein